MISQIRLGLTAWVLALGLAAAMSWSCSHHGGGGPWMVSIAVTPASPALPLGMAQALVAMGTRSDGKIIDLTGVVDWSSSDALVATVSQVVGSAGLVQSVAVGVATIEATDPVSHVKGSTILTVTAASLVIVELTPTNPTIAQGTSQPFVATGIYTDNSTQDLTSAVNWSSGDTLIAVVGNTAGSHGLATGISMGSAWVTAIDPGTNIQGSTNLTVTAAILTSITVTPASPSIALGTTQNLTATGTFSDNTTQDLTTLVGWTSSSPGVATVSSAPGSLGLATSVSVGSATITATDPTTLVTGSTTLTVTAAALTSLDVTPVNPSIALGTTQSLTAIGTYSDATTQDLTNAVTWSSSSPAVATASNAPGSQGLATSVSVGSSTMTATDSASSIQGSTTLTVTAAILTSIAVTPVNPAIALGTTQLLTATGTYSDNTTQDLTTAVTWSSSSPAVGTVSNAVGSQGLATSVTLGGTTVTATDPGSGIAGSTALTVSAAILTSIAVTPVNPSVALGTTQLLTATGTYSDNTTQNLTNAVTWSSSNRAVGTVSNAVGSQGLATSVSAGFTTITAADPATTVTGTTSVTVTPAILTSIAVTPVNPSIALGTTQNLTATGTYSDATTQDLTTVVTWSSSSLAVAIASNAPGSQGLATSVSVGSSTMTATDSASSIQGSTTLTVTAAILTSIAVTPVNPSIALGTTQVLTATGTYSDNSTQDLTTAVTWSSSSPAVATVSNAPGSHGLATSASTGSTTLTATDPASSVAGTTSLTVTAAVLTSIAVAPVNTTLVEGSTQPFTATGTYSDSSTQDLTDSVTWSSSSPSVASISNAAGSHGLATSASPGSTTVTATDPASSVAGSTTLTVSANISLYSASSASAATGSLTIATPVNTNVGDLMIASIAIRPSSAIITPPATGWALVRRIDNGASIANSLAIYTRVAVSGEPANHTWAFSSSTGSAGGIAVFSAVDVANPIDVDAGQATPFGLTHSTPSVTTTSPHVMLFTSHDMASSAAWAPPAGMTKAFDVASLSVPSGAGICIVGTYALQTAVVATGVKSAVASNDSDTGNAHILALRRRP